MLNNLDAGRLPVVEATEASEILRHCVTCGLCTATCPTYLLTNDDNDSPRGRNRLIREMLASDQAPTEEQVAYIDHCLSCLSCMTTCPSGVDYMHLIDQARIHVERHYRRPWSERARRRLAATVIPSPLLFSLSLKTAALIRPLTPLLPSGLRSMLELAPAGPVRLTRGLAAGTHHAETGVKPKRVALLSGCAQQVLEPAINEATLRLLKRHGAEVVVARGAGCCGALNYHMGRETPALAQARSNIDAWHREYRERGLDAIIINASGCGTTVKDYGHLFRDEPVYADKARLISSLAKDITEFMSEQPLQAIAGQVPPLKVAYHSACSMQHGQRIRELPKQLLRAVGFEVVSVPESHLCCGSAGTYNLLQPKTAGQLKERKLRRIGEVRADLVAGGNIGCMVQLQSDLPVPMVHTVELLDWATGGPRPTALNKTQGEPS